MNRSLTNRLNALEQRLNAGEPNGIILGVRAVLALTGGKASEGKSRSELEESRLAAIDALRRSTCSSAAKRLLDLLEQPLDRVAETSPMPNEFRPGS